MEKREDFRQFPRAANVRIFILVILAIYTGPFADAKVLRGDVVTMKNGDRFRGEVKTLQSGILYIAADYGVNDLRRGRQSADSPQLTPPPSAITYQGAFPSA